MALRWEVYRALRLPSIGLRASLLNLFIQKPLAHFVELALKFDHAAAVEGFSAASRCVLPAFVQNVAVKFAAPIPKEGPLIVACNHPGSVDALVVASQLPRSDIKVIARDMPFLRYLPGINQAMIYSTRDMNHRAVVLRQALRHLRAGGVLLVFASGNLDPEPTLMPGATNALDDWTSSPALLLLNVPGVRLMVSITSGMISRRWYNHPLVCLFSNRWQRQFRAEFFQICHQMLYPGRHKIFPQVSFSKSYSFAEITSEEIITQRSIEKIRQAIIAKAKQQMLDHLEADPSHSL